MTDQLVPAPAAARVRLEARRLADLAPADYNPRSISDEALAGLGQSIEHFGVVQPLVVNRRSEAKGWPAGSRETVVSGHQRLRALLVRGSAESDVVVVDLTAPEERALNVAQNSQAISGEWTPDALALIDEIAAAMPELSDALLMGDLRDAIQDMFPPAPTAIEDEVPLPPDAATTKRGDLIVLGRHRLLCADAGSAADLDRLLDGAPVHLVNTDPPYNVRVEPRSNNAIAAGLSSYPKAEHHHQALDVSRFPGKASPTHAKMRPKDRPLENDFLDDDEFARRLRQWFGNLARVLLPGRAAYIWGGYANVANYPPALKEAGLYFSQTIIWDKQHPVLTRKDFMGAHEWCFYSWKEGAAHQFFGPANVPDLWAVKKVNPQSMVHLTEKPVELAVRAITYSSREGENVLDLFGGSGSTLMGAEQTGRNALLVEIDALYCDVIVARYETFTGKKAERLAKEPS